MYELIKDLLLEEHHIDVSLHTTYNDFFETNFRETFHKVDTEDIKDLNKHLLDTQITFFTKNVLHRLPKTSPVISDDTEEEGQNIILESLKRVIHLSDSSRFHYEIKENVDKKRITIEKIIIPIEANILFIGPFLIMSLNDNLIRLHLRGTITMSQREFGIYTPYYTDDILVKGDTLKISFMNQLYGKPSMGSDVYKISSYENGQVTITYPEGEFKVGDYLRICNFENMNIEDDTCLRNIYLIKEVEKDKLKIEGDQLIQKGLYVMNMSLQHTIHLVYT